MSHLPSLPPSSHASPNVIDLTNSHITPSTPLRPTTRKITIRNLNRTPDSVPAAYFVQTTAKLQKALTTILTEGTLQDSLEELYRGVENLVRENKGQELYDMLYFHCEDFVQNDLRTKVEQGILGSVGIAGDGGVRAVETIENVWGKWTSQLVFPPPGNS